MIDAGHRNIAFISGEPWMEASDQRMEDTKGVAVAGIPVDPSLIVENSSKRGRAATLQLMGGVRPDAFFCANDLMAGGCYEALKELGERVETVAVMGYDDQRLPNT